MRLTDSRGLEAPPKGHFSAPLQETFSSFIAVSLTATSFYLPTCLFAGPVSSGQFVSFARFREWTVDFR